MVLINLELAEALPTSIKQKANKKNLKEKFNSVFKLCQIFNGMSMCVQCTCHVYMGVSVNILSHAHAHAHTHFKSD